MTNPFDAASRDARLDPQDPSAKARLSAEAQRTGLRGAGFSISRVGWVFDFRGDAWGLPGVFSLSLSASDPRYASALPDPITAVAMSLSALRLPLPTMCREVPRNCDLNVGSDETNIRRYVEIPLIWQFCFAPGNGAAFTPRAFPFNEPGTAAPAWFIVPDGTPTRFPQSWLTIGRDLYPPLEGPGDLKRPSSRFPAVYRVGSSPDRIFIERKLFREEATTDPRSMMLRGQRLYQKLALGVFYGARFYSVWPTVGPTPLRSDETCRAYTAYEGRVEAPSGISAVDFIEAHRHVFSNLAGWRAMSEDGLEIPILDRSPDWDKLNIHATRCRMNCRVRYRPNGSIGSSGVASAV